MRQGGGELKRMESRKGLASNRLSGIWKSMIIEWHLLTFLRAHAYFTESLEREKVFLIAVVYHHPLFVLKTTFLCVYSSFVSHTNSPELVSGDVQFCLHSCLSMTTLPDDIRKARPEKRQPKCVKLYIALTFEPLMQFKNRSIFSLISFGVIFGWCYCRTWNCLQSNNL